MPQTDWKSLQCATSELLTLLASETLGRFSIFSEIPATPYVDAAIRWC